MGRARDRIDAALVAVAAGALVFTCVNVTLFAVQHGTPAYIGWLLDPLASVALLAVLIGDGVLSRHGLRAGGWATALKFTAGAAMWAMNVWAAVAARDGAGVLLHSVAPALVIGLAEAAPAYRVGFARVLDRLAAEAAAEAATEAVARAVVVEPNLAPDATPPALPVTSRPQPTASARRRAGATVTGADRAGVSARGRTDEQLRAELRAAVASGRLGGAPSAEAIRRVLRIAPARARRLRDEHAAPTPTPIHTHTTDMTDRTDIEAELEGAA